MTPQVLNFVHKQRYKLQGKVIEIGSLDVNGGIRTVVDVSVGVDMRSGRGVDLVCPVENLLNHFEPGSFDACVSTETLEHVQDWKGFIRTTWDLVKEGGYIVITMASKFKKRHAYPDDYWRFDEEMIRKIYPNLESFKTLGDKPEKYTSIGWVVKKEGQLGDLDFSPMVVK